MNATERSDLTLLRLHTSEDVLAQIPFLVGFHPSQSLVGLALDDARRLAFCCRLDLPPPDAPAATLTAGAGELVALFRRHGASAVVLVAYTGDPRVRRFLRLVRRAFESARVTVVELLRADGRRYWSELCLDRGCCPPEGTPYDLAASELTAAAVAGGAVAWESEEAVRSTFAPAPSVGVADATRAFLAELEGWPDGAFVESGMAYVVPLLLGWLREPRSLTDEEVARVSVYCSHRDVRDAAWSLMRQESAGRHREFWREVARRSQPAYAVAPLTLFAFAAWRSGDGILARLAVHAALDLDPDYTLAGMLALILTYGVRPTDLPERRSMED